MNERKTVLVAKKKKRRIGLIIGIVAAALAVVAIVLGIVFGKANMQVSDKIGVSDAQTIVDEAFDNLAKKTALGAKKILDASEVKVESVEYGYEKDVILECTYTSLDVKGALTENINDLMCDAYMFYLSNESQGKKTNATKVNIELSSDISEYLDTAEKVSGEITLRIYETDEGMKLYLTSDDIDACTGGLVSVAKTIKETNEIEYEGQTVDISTKNTLRTGIVDCISIENKYSAKPATGNFIVNAIEDFKYDFYRNFIEKDRWTYIVSGLGTTLAITGLALCIGVIIGFIVAVVRCTNQMTGKLVFIDRICRLYLTVTRGTPVMVQLLIIYFVMLLPMHVDKFVAAVICFGLNSGAYVAEIVRGGIMSVDKGQIEAGRSLGFTYVQTMVNFVVPQAFKAILPALANEFITLLKESSVAFYIGVSDLTQGGLKIRSITYSDFMPLLAVAVIYLVLVLILTKLVSILERRLAKSDH